MNLAAIITLSAITLSLTTTVEARGKKHATHKVVESTEQVEYCSSKDDEHTIVYVCSEAPWLPKETAQESDCAGKVSRGEDKDGNWKLSWDVVCADGHHKGSVSAKGTGKADASKLWVK